MNVQVSYGFSYSAWASVSMRTAPADGQSAAQPAAEPVEPGRTSPATSAPGSPATSPAASVPVAQPVLHPGSAWLAQLPTMTGGAGFGVFALAQPMVLSPMFAQLGFPLVTPSAVAGQGAGAQSASDAGVTGAAATVDQPADRGQETAPTGGSEATPATSGEGVPAAAPAPQPPPASESEKGAERPRRATVERLDKETFEHFRLKQHSMTRTTSLKLELETREGDRIVLDFSQLDVRDRTRFRGVDGEGNRFRLRESTEATARLVNLEVTGELSEEERAAIDEFLGKLVDLADAYFGGSMDTTVARLEEMDFDAETLLDVSFQMSVSRRVEMTRGYGNGEDGLTRLASRDGEVKKTLEFFADGQRRVLESAQESLHRTTAAKMVRHLLPAMLQPTDQRPEEPSGERMHDGGR